MEVLEIVRGLTLAFQVTLVALLLRLVRRRSLLPRAAAAMWLAVAAVTATIATNAFVSELFTVVRAVAAWDAKALHTTVYHVGFLVNATASALLPFALLRFALAEPRARALAAAGLGVVGLGAVAAVARGALASWPTLMSATQLLTLLGIAGYLALCGVLLLRGTRAVDEYLAGLIVIETLFQVLVPVQEVFYQSVGIEAAKGLWLPLQSLQLTKNLAQAAIVGARIHTLRRLGAPAAGAAGAAPAAPATRRGALYPPLGRR